MRMFVDRIPMERDRPQLSEAPQLEHLLQIRDAVPVKIDDLQLGKFRDGLVDGRNVIERKVDPTEALRLLEHVVHQDVRVPGVGQPVVVQPDGSGQVLPVPPPLGRPPRPGLPRALQAYPCGARGGGSVQSAGARFTLQLLVSLEGQVEGDLRVRDRVLGPRELGRAALFRFGHRYVRRERRR